MQQPPLNPGHASGEGHDTENLVPNACMVELDSGSHTSLLRAGRRGTVAPMEAAFNYRHIVALPRTATFGSVPSTYG
jgi:hypothetical protein